MAHYMFYMSAVILIVCSLTFLLSSCTELIDGPPKPYTGPKIDVKFLFGGVNNQSSEVVTRKGAASQNPSEGEALSSPFGEVEGDNDPFIMHVVDEIYMYATVEEDRDVKLRGIIPLDPGTELRIVAYQDGTIYHTHKDYTINNNGELVGPRFQVNPGNYSFVAYSYNNTPLPSHHNLTLSNIDPSVDLLWGRFPADGTTFPIEESSFDDIPITLSHIFSQVKLIVTTEEMTGTPSIMGLNNVRILPDSRADLDIRNGTLSKGSSIVQEFSWSALSSTTVTSNQRTVYTFNDNPTKLMFGTITLNGTPTFTNEEARFNKQLQPGVSYTLKVSFKKGDMNEITITVEPNYAELSFESQNPAPQTLTVTAKRGPNLDPSLPWTLSSNDTWLWLTLNANGTGGGTTLNGTGSQTVYLKPGLNSGNAPRYTNISLDDKKNPKKVVTNVKQNYFEAIGIPGTGIERIYIDDNGGNPKLLLARDNSHPGAFFQFGGIRGWKHQSSGGAGNAAYNPSLISSTWLSGWQPTTVSNYTVPHDVVNLRNGIGDPCRLVGYTQAEIKAAIATNNPNAYAPDNKVWRLPTGTQLYGYQNVSGGSNNETFPRHGRINETGSFSSFDTGYYWSSWKTGGGTPSSVLAGYLNVSNTNSKFLNSAAQATGMSIRCVAQ